MTGIDHENTAGIDLAVEWLASHWDEALRTGPLTKVVRERFGLNFHDAIKAVAEARRLREGE